MYAVMYKITIVNRIYPEYLFFNLILSSQKNQDSLCNIWRSEKKNIFVVIRSIKNIFSMKKVIITKCCPFKFWVFCLRPLPLFFILIFWNLHCGEGVMKWKMLAGLKVSYDKFNKNYCIINEVQIYPLHHQRTLIWI